MEEIIKEFIEWATNCGEDTFYIFENSEEAIAHFIKQRED